MDQGEEASHGCLVDAQGPHVCKPGSLVAARPGGLVSAWRSPQGSDGSPHYLASCRRSTLLLKNLQAWSGPDVPRAAKPCLLSRSSLICREGAIQRRGARKPRLAQDNPNRRYGRAFGALEGCSHLC